MKEEWKDIYFINSNGEIIDYRKLYQVSNHGQVKSLNYNKTGKEQIMKPFEKNGFLCVRFNKNGCRKVFHVDELVNYMFGNDEKKDEIKKQIKLEWLPYYYYDRFDLENNFIDCGYGSEYRKLNFDLVQIQKCVNGEVESYKNYKWRKHADNFYKGK